MAIDASGFKVGNNGQVLTGPDGTNYWGQFSNPTENDPKNTSAWGYQGLAPGATQFMPSTNGWSTDPSAQFYSSSDFTNVPDSLKSYFSQPGTTIQGFKSAPVGVQVTQAPEESFLSSFMQGPGMVLGSALGANALFGGGLSSLLGGGASLFPGEAVIGNAFNPYGGSLLSSLGNALSNFPTGLRSLISGASGASGAGGLTDAPWGVNPQGGNMDWWNDFMNAVGDNYGTGGVSGSMDAVAPFNGFDSAGVNPYSDYGSSTGYGSPGTSYQTGPGGSIADVTGTLPPEVVNNPGFMDQLKSVMQQTGLNPTSALRLLGQLGATGLGIYGANQQANKISNLSQQYANYGAPYRAMLAQSYADPSGFLKNSPDIQAAVGQGTDAMARSLSTQGNPTGSGAALQQLQNYATQGLYGQLGNERNRLANFGGLSNFNAAAPGLAGQAITAQGGALNALGSGISAITNPPTTLEQALNQINGMQGLNSNTQNWNTGTGI